MANCLINKKSCISIKTLWTGNSPSVSINLSEWKFLIVKTFGQEVSGRNGCRNSIIIRDSTDQRYDVSCGSSIYRIIGVSDSGLSVVYSSGDGYCQIRAIYGIKGVFLK